MDSFATQAAGETPRARAARVKLIIFDVDGVLTDGGIYVGPHGELFKPFHVRDGMGITLAHRAGLATAIITGAPPSRSRAARRSSTSRRSTRVRSTSARRTRSSRRSEASPMMRSLTSATTSSTCRSSSRWDSPPPSPTPPTRCARVRRIFRASPAGTVPRATSSNSFSRRRGGGRNSSHRSTKPPRRRTPRAWGSDQEGHP